MLESLSPLRADLKFFPSAPTAAGAPTWVIYDPLRHRYFQIGALEFTLLRHWKAGISSEALAQRTQQESSQRVDAETVEALHTFLYKQQLLRPIGEAGVKFLKNIFDRSKVSLWKTLSQRYLFFRIPLWQPDKFLENTLPFIRPLFHKEIIWLLLIFLGLGLFLVSRQWDSFLHSFPYLFTISGMITFALTLALVKVVHELGHAYTAKYYGLKVPYIGVAFLVMWPVLYTDTSHAWRLTSRYKRLRIDAAGLTVELSLAIVATFIWNFLPDGSVRSAVFMLATVTWVMTLFINLNPFMRFDGYYLLADMWGFSNLQERSFARARWWVREKLFAFGDPEPEAIPENQQHLLVLYAIGVWVYRFFLFLGIAVLVYYMFFKVLGILLMALEIFWFIAAPVVKELYYWWQRRSDMHWNRNTLITSLFFIGLLLLLFLPWQRHYNAPALYRAQQQMLYMPHSGQVEFSALKAGQSVKAGELLVQLRNPDLEHQLQQAEREAAYLNLQLQAEATDTVLKERQQVLRQQLVEARAEIAQVKEQQAQLALQAPFTGEIRQVAEELVVGAWINPSLALAVLVNREQTQITAYVTEQMIGRLELKDTVRVYLDDTQLTTFNARITDIEQYNSQQLPEREHALASIFGGEIAVRIDPRTQALIPEQAIYRLQLQAETALPPIEHVQVANVRLNLKEEESIVSSLWKSVVAVLIRESGF